MKMIYLKERVIAIGSIYDLSSGSYVILFIASTFLDFLFRHFASTRSR